MIKSRALHFLTSTSKTKNKLLINHPSNAESFEDVRFVVAVPRPSPSMLECFGVLDALNQGTLFPGGPAFFASFARLPNDTLEPLVPTAVANFHPFPGGRTGL